MARLLRKRRGDDQAGSGAAKKQKIDDSNEGNPITDVPKTIPAGQGESSSRVPANPTRIPRHDLFIDDVFDENDPLWTGDIDLGGTYKTKYMLKHAQQSNTNFTSGNSVPASSDPNTRGESGYNQGVRPNVPSGDDPSVVKSVPGKAEAVAGSGRRELLARIREATTRLNELTNGHRPCGCPPDCPGSRSRSQARNTQDGNRSDTSGTSGSADTDSSSSESTPPEGPIDLVRSISTVLAEAEGSKMVNLPRLGPEGTQGRLRISLQVHTDPYGYRTRLGYYGELFLTPNTDNQERPAGYITAWRISKPNSGHPLVNPQTWVDEWLIGPMGDGKSAESIDTNNIKEPLRRLYDVFGQPRPNSQTMTANRVELGDSGNEIVFVPMICIFDEFSRNGLFKHATDMFFNLCTNGTLPEWYNMNSPVTFLIEPGIPMVPQMALMWFREYPQQEGESEIACLGRIQRILEGHYRRHGFVDYDKTSGQCIIMGRVINPWDKDPGDRLLPNPRSQEA
ncbi:hypothetical protein VP1G_04026 [Cytospora mali]|uniref:Uncharacterized protein n=1 Tax=Cytospora mali TaxID=578113 RepID=A0A194UYA1_CYTMA|nr:hypothetical protein VP1G_04026 [Valsa mali var. pyri (nom. inval.)]